MFGRRTGSDGETAGAAPYASLAHPGSVLLSPADTIDWPAAGWRHEPPGLVEAVIAAAPGPADPRPAEAWLWHASYALMALGAAGAAEGAESVGRFRALAAALVASRTLDLPDDAPVPARFAAARTLLAFVAAAGLVLRDPAQRADFLSGTGAEVGRLVERHAVRAVAERPAAALSQRNNHALQRGAILAGWGAFTGNAAAFSDGLGAYRAALATIGPDGALANEALRGASAAWYSNLAIMLMTTIARIAAVQGHDLVAEREGGRGLDEAIGFLLAVIDRPALIHRHAARNLYPHPQHGEDPFRTDLGFVDGYHRSRHYLAWIPVYLSLAPASPHAAALTALFRRHTAYFPPAIEYAGGQVYAFARPIPPW